MKVGLPGVSTGEVEQIRHQLKKEFAFNFIIILGLYIFGFEFWHIILEFMITSFVYHHSELVSRNVFAPES